MIDYSMLVDGICDIVTEPDQDNYLQMWSINIELNYGSILINDIDCVHIKVVELSDYKETLLDISMPWTCYKACKEEVKQNLLDLLIQPD